MVKLELSEVWLNDSGWWWEVSESKCPCPNCDKTHGEFRAMFRSSREANLYIKWVETKAGENNEQT